MPCHRPVFFFLFLFFFFCLFFFCFLFGFFFLFSLRNRKSICQKTSYAFNKSELVKYIIFLVLSSIRTRNLPFSGPADCKFVYVHFKCFSLKCILVESVNHLMPVLLPT